MQIKVNWRVLALLLAGTAVLPASLAAQANKPKPADPKAAAKLDPKAEAERLRAEKEAELRAKAIEAGGAGAAAAADAFAWVNKNVKFDLGFAPDQNGNIGTMAGTQVNYLGALKGLPAIGWLSGFNAGINYYKVTRSEQKIENGVRDVTVMEDQIIKLSGLAYKFSFGDEKGFNWYFNPSANGVHYFQKRQLSHTNRHENTFKNEESNMESTQLNTGLEVVFNFGQLNAQGKNKARLTLLGSYTPLSDNVESGHGFDNSIILAKDKFNNDRYSGPTGDYSYHDEAESKYMDGSVMLDVRDMFGSADMLFGARFNRIEFDQEYDYFKVDNGAVVKDVVSKKILRQEITGILGMELAFLDFGSTVPLATFGLTHAEFTDIHGKQKEAWLFSAGIAFKN